MYNILCFYIFRLGESCSHVTALLFKLEATVRLGYTSQAGTDKPCEGSNFFTEKVTPAPISEIKFYSDKVINRVRETGRKRETISYKPPTEDEKKRFLQTLAGSSNPPVVLSMFKEYSHMFKPQDH